MANKKAMAASTGIVIAVIAIFVFAGIGIYGVNKLSTTSEKTAAVTQTLTADDFCSNNPSIDLKTRIYNTINTTAETYLSGTIYIKNLETGSISTATVSQNGATGNFTTISNALGCKNKVGYKIWIQSAQDGVNAAEEYVTITPAMLNQDPVEVTLKATQFSGVQIKGYDLKLHQTFVNGTTVDYVDMNASTFNETGAVGGDAITIDADGYIEAEITAKPANNNGASGKAAMVCVNYADDSNTNDWDSNSVVLKEDGVALAEAVRTANDAVALSSYEKCFAATHPVGKSAAGTYQPITTFYFYVRSASGVNPDMDPTIRYVALGDYKSQKITSDVLENVGFRDDSSRTQIASTSSQVLTFNIA